jgi:hypothetical protein
MGTDAGDGPAATVLVVAEEDYCFGQGELTLRVDQIDVANPVIYRNDTWYRVCGVQVGWDGRSLHQREILVRARLIHLPATGP